MDIILTKRNSTISCDGNKITVEYKPEGTPIPFQDKTRYEVTLELSGSVDTAPESEYPNQISTVSLKAETVTPYYVPIGQILSKTARQNGYNFSYWTFKKFDDNGVQSQEYSDYVIDDNKFKSVNQENYPYGFPIKFGTNATLHAWYKPLDPKITLNLEYHHKIGDVDNLFSKSSNQYSHGESITTKIISSNIETDAYKVTGWVVSSEEGNTPTVIGYTEMAKIEPANESYVKSYDITNDITHINVVDDNGAQKSSLIRVANSTTPYVSVDSVKRTIIERNNELYILGEIVELFTTESTENFKEHRKHRCIYYPKTINTLNDIIGKEIKVGDEFSLDTSDFKNNLYEISIKFDSVVKQKAKSFDFFWCLDTDPTNYTQASTTPQEINANLTKDLLFKAMNKETTEYCVCSISTRRNQQSDDLQQYYISGKSGFVYALGNNVNNIKYEYNMFGGNGVYITISSKPLTIYGAYPNKDYKGNQLSINDTEITSDTVECWDFTGNTHLESYTVVPNSTSQYLSDKYEIKDVYYSNIYSYQIDASNSDSTVYWLPILRMWHYRFLGYKVYRGFISSETEITNDDCVYVYHENMNGHFGSSEVILYAIENVYDTKLIFVGCWQEKIYIENFSAQRSRYKYLSSSNSRGVSVETRDNGEAKFFVAVNECDEKNYVAPYRFNGVDSPAKIYINYEPNNRNHKYLCILWWSKYQQKWIDLTRALRFSHINYFAQDPLEKDESYYTGHFTHSINTGMTENCFYSHIFGRIYCGNYRSTSHSFGMVSDFNNECQYHYISNEEITIDSITYYLNDDKIFFQTNDYKNDGMSEVTYQNVLKPLSYDNVYRPYKPMESIKTKKRFSTNEGEVDFGKANEIFKKI